MKKQAEQVFTIARYARILYSILIMFFAAGGLFIFFAFILRTKPPALPFNVYVEIMSFNVLLIGIVSIFPMCLFLNLMSQKIKISGEDISKATRLFKGVTIHRPSILEIGYFRGKPGTRIVVKCDNPIRQIILNIGDFSDLDQKQVLKFFTRQPDQVVWQAPITKYSNYMSSYIQPDA